MDAGLAKVMNSSVGTSALKALDTILKTDNTTIANNAADRLYNKLMNNVKLIGSDELMYHYKGTWTGTPQYKYSETAITFDKSGTVVFKTRQLNLDTSTTKYCYLAVNGGASGSNRIVSTGNVYVPSGATVELSLAVNVTAGTKYYVEIFGHGDFGVTGYVDVCGTLSPWGGVTVTETT